jgi:general secretion pathway protein K
MRLARQRGVALLVAIVMFAVCTTVAAAITYNKTMAARRAAATFTMEQALQAGMAAEAMAGIVLEQAASNQQTALHQDWAMSLGPVEIENTGIWIQAQLEDLSGRFNLNSLVTWSAADNLFVANQHQVDVFRELLQHLDIDTRYANLMVDWLDTDINPQPMDGGEDTLYLTQVPPYRPPNTFITHPSELLALPGFGAENYAKIAPYVTAGLPADARVNVCTAPALILEVTENDPQGTSGYDDATLKTLRAKGCSPVRQHFLAGIQDPARRQAIEDRVSESSSWFRLRTHIRVGTAEFVLYSVLLRETSSNRARTVQRSFGSE